MVAESLTDALPRGGREGTGANPSRSSLGATAFRGPGTHCHRPSNPFETFPVESRRSQGGLDDLLLCAGSDDARSLARLGLSLSRRLERKHEEKHKRSESGRAIFHQAAPVFVCVHQQSLRYLLDGAAFQSTAAAVEIPLPTSQEESATLSRTGSARHVPYSVGTVDFGGD